MITRKYNSIMQRGESYRNRWALGLSIVLSLFIFTGFAFYKGYLNLNLSSDMVVEKTSVSQAASVVSVDIAPSPFENSKRMFEAAFSEIASQYRLFKESVSSVLVPFVTSIDVYERK